MDIHLEGVEIEGKGVYFHLAAGKSASSAESGGVSVRLGMRVP